MPTQQGSGFVDDLGRLAIPFALIAAKEGVELIQKNLKTGSKSSNASSSKKTATKASTTGKKTATSKSKQISALNKMREEVSKKM